MRRLASGRSCWHPANPSHRPATPPSPSCAACSSRAPRPTARCTPRRARLRLDARDRAFATQLTLRHGPAPGHARPPHRALPARPVDAARPAGRSPRCGSGVFQLPFLDRVPAHAAVGESVELAKRDAPRRRAARQRGAAPRGARGAPRRSAAARRARRRRRRCSTRTRAGSPSSGGSALGAETARALMAADNEPAEPALRANTLATDAPRRSRARCRARPRRRRRRPSSSTAPFDAFGAPLWDAAACSCRSRAPRWRVARRSTRSPASACSTCAPPPAARPPTWPR